MSPTSLSIDSFSTWLEMQYEGDRQTKNSSIAVVKTVKRMAEKQVISSELLGDVHLLLPLYEQIQWELKTNNHLTENSARTYVSRFRKALREFSDPPPTFAHSKKLKTHHGPRLELSVEGEISEAFSALERWPKLKPFLLPSLTRAVVELLGSSTQQSKSPQIPEDNKR